MTRVQGVDYFVDDMAQDVKDEVNGRVKTVPDATNLILTAPVEIEADTTVTYYYTKGFPEIAHILDLIFRIQCSLCLKSMTEIQVRNVLPYSLDSDREGLLDRLTFDMNEATIK